MCAWLAGNSHLGCGDVRDKELCFLASVLEGIDGVMADARRGVAALYGYYQIAVTLLDAGYL